MKPSGNRSLGRSNNFKAKTATDQGVIELSQGKNRPHLASSPVATGRKSGRKVVALGPREVVLLVGLTLLGVLVVVALLLQSPLASALAMAFIVVLYRAIGIESDPPSAQ